MTNGLRCAALALLLVTSGCFGHGGFGRSLGAIDGVVAAGAELADAIADQQHEQQRASQQALDEAERDRRARDSGQCAAP